MKKISIIKLCLILVTSFILLNTYNNVYAYNDFEENKQTSVNYEAISEEMLEQMEENDGKNATNKILKYDVATQTTTEVDMEEIERVLANVGKSNITSTSSYTPPIYSSYSMQDRNDFLMPYAIREDEKNLDVTKFALVQNAQIAPYIYNCRLIINGGVEIGTGTLVGPKVLLTAAHCVMDVDDPDHFSFQEWRAYPGFHGYSYSMNGTTISAGLLSYYYSNDWDKTEENQYDWCICVLDNEIGMKVGWNGCSLYNDTNLQNLSIKEYGYPWSVLDSKYQMYTSGNVETVQTNYTINSAICAKGMSGGPIERTSDNRIVGIISGYKTPTIFSQDYRTIAVRINQNIINIITNLCK